MKTSIAATAFLPSDRGRIAVPWCEDCDRFLSPSTVTLDGSCPTCGRAVEVGEVARAAGAEEALPPVPWHLKLLGVAIVIYLGFRLLQAIGWMTS